ncbi:MAG: metallophosphoesterase [Clostridia bacterium]|nr:metallophosphoesterase [Clostridia bacterium]
MAIFTIADLHLSTLESTNKSMEVFGNRWTDYIKRLENNWKRLISPDDTVVIPGDISWALSLPEAESDLKFLDSLPGKKILGKGNHDFWWCTMRKHDAFFEKIGIKTISFLFNNAIATENLIIAGTRGWYHDEDAGNQPSNADFLKLTSREAQRLKTSLTAAVKLKEENPDSEIVVFMHFPPFWNGKASENIIAVLKEFGIKRLYFGHIHGNYTIDPKFEYDGIEMSLVSADYLSFTPKIVSLQYP